MAVPDSAQGTVSLVTAWMPLLTAGVALISALAGILSTTLLELFKTKAVHRREKEARDEVRDEKRAEMNNSFQRETVLALQDKLIVSYQSVTDASIDRKAKNQGEMDWDDTLLPEPILDTLYSSKIDLEVLASRVEDEEVRKLLNAYDATVVAVMESHNVAEAKTNDAASFRAFKSLNSQLGETLRRLNGQVVSFSLSESEAWAQMLAGKNK